MFNGEIYNFRELRRELEGRGRVFRSQRRHRGRAGGVRAWGEQAFQRLEGMWAIVIVDLRRRRLVGSRDRFGIKPLYWSSDGTRLFLASEIKQLVDARAGGRDANAPLVTAHTSRKPATLAWRRRFSTAFGRSRPASWFEVPLDGDDDSPDRFHRYWDLAEFRCPDPRHPPQSYPDAVAQSPHR